MMLDPIIPSHQFAERHVATLPALVCRTLWQVDFARSPVIRLLFGISGLAPRFRQGRAGCTTGSRTSCVPASCRTNVPTRRSSCGLSGTGSDPASTPAASPPLTTRACEGRHHLHRRATRRWPGDHRNAPVRNRPAGTVPLRVLLAGGQSLQRADSPRMLAVLRATVARAAPQTPMPVDSATLPWTPSPTARCIHRPQAPQRRDGPTHDYTGEIPGSLASPTGAR
jgi:hypothetical protein